jgi:hypothetical protein
MKNLMFSWAYCPLVTIGFKGPIMLCDACHNVLSGNDAVLVRPCGHRVHANKCEGGACKACKSADTACSNLGLIVLGLLCGVVITLIGFKFQYMVNEVELAMADMRAMADVRRGLDTMGARALASPELRQAIRRSLALIHKEIMVCVGL